MKEECNWKPDVCPPERTITVAKINIDEDALNSGWAKLKKAWDEIEEWERTATPEEKKKAYEEWESFGGGH